MVKSYGPAANITKCLTAIDGTTETDYRKAFRRRLLAKVGPEEYYSWFMQGHFSEYGPISDKSLDFKAPNHFVQKMWEQRYPWIKDEIEKLNKR